jgi:hypothetical protein
VEVGVEKKRKEKRKGATAKRATARLAVAFFLEIEFSLAALSFPPPKA